MHKAHADKTNELDYRLSIQKHKCLPLLNALNQSMDRDLIEL